MPPVDRLPPPPAVPVRSPSASVAGEMEMQVPGRSGGPSLEARVCTPSRPNRAVLLCHPHPLYGGSMHSPVPLAIAKILSEKGGSRVAWARFNFRGVGASAGKYDGGRGEVDDADTLLDVLERTAGPVPVTVCGHSFGASVAFKAAALHPRVDRLLLIAPSPHLFEGIAAPGTPPARVTIFVGDRDELYGVDDVRNLAGRLGAELEIFEGFDHHFLKSRRVLAEAAFRVIAPEAQQATAP